MTNTSQTTVPFHAEKARSLEFPRKTLFLILAPIPLMLVVGIWGATSGWLGNKAIAQKQSQSETLDIAELPNAKVKELEKDKKYETSSIANELQSSTMSLDIANENSRMLQDKPIGEGITQNDPTEVDRFKREMNVSASNSNVTGLSENEKQLSSNHQKRLIGRREGRSLAVIQSQNDRKLREIYKQPATETQYEAREAAIEERRLKQNDRLLDIMANQSQPTTARNSSVSLSNRNSKANAKNQMLVDSNDVHTISNYNPAVIKSAAKTKNSFYGLNGRQQQSSRPSKVPGAIRAVVHGDGDGITVTNGSSVFLRMLETTSLNINGEPLILPAQSLITGQVKISGDRIDITVSTIRIDNYLYSVNLTAYDLDGRRGLYVPDLQIKQQTAQAFTQQGAQVINPGYIVGGNIGQQVGSQVAQQGVNAAMNGARNLIRRKVSQPKASIKPNYQVLLVSSSRRATEASTTMEESDVY